MGAKALDANRPFTGKFQSLCLYKVCQHCHVLLITKSVGRGKHAPSFPKIRVCLYWIKLDIPFIIHACISDFFYMFWDCDVFFFFLLIHNNLYHRCLGYTDIYSRYYTYVIIFLYRLKFCIKTQALWITGKMECACTAACDACTHAIASTCLCTCI